MTLDVEKIVREYIDKTIHLSLATVSNNAPWVCEVHFVYDEDLNIYFRSAASRRHSQEIEVNQNVAGNIVKQHPLDEYPHAISFEGKVQLLDNEAAQEKVFPYFEKRLKADRSILDDARNVDGHMFYKITVDTWYAFGKFGGDKGEKYKLIWNGGKK